MFKKIIFMFCVGIFTTALATGVMAFGIGGYMTVGGGNKYHDFSKYEYAGTGNIKDSTDFAIGGGLIMDSNLAGNRIFNWRMKIGGEQLKEDREKEMTLTRMSMSHIFGFGVVRTKVVRFWFGPSIGGSYSWGDRTNYRYFYGLVPLNLKFQKIVTGTYLTPFIFPGVHTVFRDQINKINYGGLDLGAVVGININLGDHVTIGPLAGFRYVFNWGAQNREIRYSLSAANSVLPLQPFIPINTGDSKNRLKVSGYEIYGDISVMIRFGGDNYGRY